MTDISINEASSSSCNPHPGSILPHSGRELPGKTPVDACSPEIAEKNADEAIRKVMVDQKRVARRKALPELAPTEPVTDAKSRKHPRKIKDVVQAVLANDHKIKAGPSVRGGINLFGSVRKMLARVIPDQTLAKVKAYRPSRKHLAIAGLALVVVWHPWLIPIVLFVTFWVVLIAYLTLGPDRVTDVVTGLWHRLRARRPELAETIRGCADKVALRADAVLDWLPAKWTEGLYLPDFSQPDEDQSTVDERPDPFDRLICEARQG